MNIDVDYNRYNMRRGELPAVFAAAVIADLFVFYLFYRNIFVCIVMLVPTIVFIFNNYKKYKVKKRKWKLTSEFEEMLGCISDSLRTGYSLENSFYEAEKELSLLYGEKRDILCELKNICSRLRLNYTVESILNDFAVRSGVEDIKNFSEIIAIAKRSGGNIISIVDQAAANIRDKREIEEEIRTLIAGKKLEYRIMSIMPAGMIIYLGICSPGYMNILYGNISGQAVMTLCLAVYALSYYIAGKIMAFDNICDGKQDAGIKRIRRKRVKNDSNDFCALYKIAVKSRFGPDMDKISKKAGKVYMGMTADKACIRFWNSWFACTVAAIVAAVLIILSGIIYSGKSTVYICILAVSAAVIIPYGRLKGLDRKLKYRNEQMIMDYPDIIGRMSLLIGAGSSMKGAWERIVNDYTKRQKKGNREFRYIYEEMRQSLFELKNGTSEALVYERFGQRIRLIPYMKFSAMLAHNLKKGNRYILEQLNMSSLDAYGQRRENVKRMGEEASSKLLLPIMLQFILVLIIIMYPAIMSL